MINLIEKKRKEKKSINIPMNMPKTYGGTSADAEWCIT